MCTRSTLCEAEEEGAVDHYPLREYVDHNVLDFVNERAEEFEAPIECDERRISACEMAK